MNKKEDLLLTGAFGELNPSDEAAFVASLSASELKEFEMLSELRRDMRHLSVPEECQVSVEMMRDRVLAAGVAPRSGFNLRWLGFALPTAACLAIGIFLFNQPGDSVVHEDKPVEVALTTPDTLKPQPNLEPSTKELVAKPNVSKPVAEGDVEEVAQLEPVRTIVARKKSVSPRKASKPMPKIAVPGAPAVNTKPKESPVDGSFDAAAPIIISIPEVSSSSDDVVVISSETISETGTQSAQEVASASGVVIDG